MLLSSSARVEVTAAAVQPYPKSTENAARPESPIFENRPSVMNAKADINPLSSRMSRNKYISAICGINENTLPAPLIKPSHTRERTIGESIAPPAKPATRSISASNSVFKKSPGIPVPNVTKNTSPARTKKAGSAKNPFRQSLLSLFARESAGTYPSVFRTSFRAAVRVSSAAPSDPFPAAFPGFKAALRSLFAPAPAFLSLSVPSVEISFSSGKKSPKRVPFEPARRQVSR